MRRPAVAAVVIALIAAGCTTAGPDAPPGGGGGASNARSPSPLASPFPDATTAPPATLPPGPSPAPEPLVWARLSLTDGPGPREDHTWTVQPGAGAAWLFGGRDAPDAFGDLWRFDLASGSWEHVEPGGAAPEPRFGHTATWVEGVGLVVWSGQANATTFFDDLWAFDPAAGAWRELPDPDLRPEARYGSCAALGPDGRLWVSHGFTEDAGRFADTWAYDFTAGRWAVEVPRGDLPVARCLHDCLWTPDGRLVLYAGQTTGVPAIGDLWTRGVATGWSKGPDGDAPAARQLYALAAAGDGAWVFGGGGDDRRRLDDLWRLDLGSLAWQPLSPAADAVTGDSPTGRSGATLIRDADRDRLLLFGGLSDDGAAGDLWSLGPLK